jgi:hypothetical protein
MQPWMPRLSALVAGHRFSAYLDALGLQLLTRLVAADCVTTAGDVEVRKVVRMLTNTPQWGSTIAFDVGLDMSLSRIGLARLILILFGPECEGASDAASSALASHVASPSSSTRPAQCTVDEAQKLLGHFHKVVPLDDPASPEVSAAARRARAAVARLFPEVALNADVDDEDKGEASFGGGSLGAAEAVDHGDEVEDDDDVFDERGD